jgi:hypothetical protein
MHIGVLGIDLFPADGCDLPLGFKEPFKSRMTDEVRKDIESKSIRVTASSHALSGVERSVAKKNPAFIRCC